MESKIITCPKCHGRLEVTNPKNQPILMISCPNPACGAKIRVRFDSGETIIAPKKNAAKVPGYLLFGTNTFKLEEGRNTVGRQNSKNNATIELRTDDKSMSRVHCLLEAVRTTNGRMKVIISDSRDKEKINKLPTEVSDEPLAEGERLVLEDGDTIKMGRQIIKFYQQELEE